MSGVEHDHRARRQEGRQVRGVVAVGARRDHQHDQVGAVHDLGQVGAHQCRGGGSLTFAGDCDAAGESGSLVRAAHVHAHVETPECQVGGGGAAAMTRSEDGDGFDVGHYSDNVYLATFSMSTSMPMPRPIRHLEGTVDQGHGLGQEVIQVIDAGELAQLRLARRRDAIDASQGHGGSGGG